MQSRRLMGGGDRSQYSVWEGRKESRMHRFQAADAFLWGGKADMDQPKYFKKTVAVYPQHYTRKTGKYVSHELM